MNLKCCLGRAIWRSKQTINSMRRAVQGSWEALKRYICGVQATVAYFLMADNRRRMPSSAYLRAELTEAHQGHQGYPPGAPLFLLCSSASPQSSALLSETAYGRGRAPA